MTADGVVCPDKKNVYSLFIIANGATVGDKVALRDGGAEGVVRIGPLVIPAAQGAWPVDLSKYGVEFLNSVYYTEQAAAANKIIVLVVFD
jgi:hypothetical protein